MCWNPSGKVAYVDMEVQTHKTMQATANKFKFLDLVASGSGIFGDDWVEGLDRCTQEYWC